MPAEKRHFWAEIRNDFFSTDVDKMEGACLATIAIDAWKTIEDDEQGSVIAQVILSEHGDILVDYRDPVARIDETAQASIQEAKAHLKEYYQQLQQGREDVFEGLHLPDGSTLSVSCHHGDVDRDETDSRTWKSLDITRIHPDGRKEPLCAVDYEPEIGLRSLVYSPENEDVVFTQEYNCDPLKSFYYSFGTSMTFPFQKGWVEVIAKDIEDANALFRRHFPDRTPGIMNYSEFYSSPSVFQNWPDDWRICHAVIDKNGLKSKADLEIQKEALNLEQKIDSARSRRESLAGKEGAVLLPKPMTADRDTL